MAEITTVVFDVGNVLIRYDGRDFLKRLFDEKTAAIVGDAMFGGKLWDELDRGVLPLKEIVGGFIERAPQYEAEIREAFERAGECIHKADYAIPWIKEVKQAGFGAYYLSNYSEHMLDRSTHALDFVPILFGGIFSCRVKMAKPEPDIYRCFLETYGKKPEECLFIDDLEANVRAAEAVGMHGWVFHGYEKDHDAIMKYLKENGKVVPPDVY